MTNNLLWLPKMLSAQLGYCVSVKTIRRTSLGNMSTAIWNIGETPATTNQLRMLRFSMSCFWSPFDYHGAVHTEREMWRVRLKIDITSQYWRQDYGAFAEVTSHGRNAVARLYSTSAAPAVVLTVVPKRNRRKSRKPSPTTMDTTSGRFRFLRRRWVDTGTGAGRCVF